MSRSLKSALGVALLVGVTSVSVVGCSSEEPAASPAGGAMSGDMGKGKMEGGDMGKMEGGDMDKGKMEGGDMGKGKMEGGDMGKGKMEGAPK